MSGEMNCKGITKLLGTVWKWILAIAYLGMLGFLVYSIKMSWLDFRYGQMQWDVLVFLLVTMLLIPVAVLAFLFLKKKGWRVVKGLLMVLMPVYLGYTFLSTLFLPMALRKSVTTEVNHYGLYDAEVTEYLERYPIEILPYELPEQIKNATYDYEYSVTLDSQLLLKASWEHEDAQAYEAFKQKLEQCKVVAEYEQDGYMIRELKPTLGALEEIRVGYRDDIRAVCYDITGTW